MRKVIRLTESDLVRLVKRVIKETSGPSFSAWLEEKSNIRGVGAYCITVENALDKNGYRNKYDDAPEEFKRFVKDTDCFYNESFKTHFGLEDYDSKVKESLKIAKDEITKKLLRDMIS